MDFSDPRHSAAELVIQGADERTPAVIGDTDILAALDRWTQRDDGTDPSPASFAIDSVQYFTITYDGQASHYHPDEAANWLSETLVRDVLFREGICVIDDDAPRMFSVRYKIQAMIGAEHLLVCPYPTASGNIGGIVVVCVNHHVTTANR